MNALIASLAVRSPTAGLVTGLGAMAADLILGVLVFSLRSAIDLDAVLRPIYALGAVVMVVIAYRVWSHRLEPAGTPVDRVHTFSYALGVGLSNPFQIVWWLTAGLAFAYLGGIVLFVGIFAGIAAWIVAFPLAIYRGSRRYPTMGRWVAVLSTALLAGFAAYFAYLALAL